MSDPTADYWKAIIASIRSLNTDLIARSRVRRRVPQSLVFMDVSRLRDRDGQSRPWEQYPWRCDIHTYIRVLIGAKAEPDDRGKCSGASIQVARMHAMEELRHDNHSLIFASHQQRESMLEADEATTISADVYPITSGQSQVASQNRESQPVLQLSEAQEKSSTSPPPS